MRAHRTLLQVALLLVAAVAVAAGGWFALIAPQRSHASRLSAQIASAQTQVATLEAARVGTPRVSATELYQLARAMPLSDDMPGILLELDRTAKASGVRLVSVQPAAGTSVVPVAVVVDGRYAHVTDFLRRLRLLVRRRPGGILAAGRLYSVESAQLALGTGNRVTATLQLDAYDYVAPPAQASNGAQGSASAPPAGAEAAGGAS